MPARDLPRKLAPILLALFDVTWGVGLILTHNDRTPGLKDVPGSLLGWGIAFTIVGILIPLGILGPRCAWPTFLLALAVWAMWFSFIVQAINPPTVSRHAPITPGGLAMFHLLLSPYRRRGSAHERQ